VHAPIPVVANPFSLDLGKSLQLLQSVLLIVTFVWAFRERKRYRMADRFSKIALEFVTKTLDTLYDDIRSQLEDVRIKLKSTHLTTDLRVEILSDFTSKLFHVRTIIVHRLRCFSQINLDAVDNIFSNMEDQFATDVGNLPQDTKHPEALSASVGSGSAELISMLMAYEVSLSGHIPLKNRIGRWWKTHSGKSE